MVSVMMRFVMIVVKFGMRNRIVFEVVRMSMVVSMDLSVWLVCRFIVWIVKLFE